jgi:hypothetical protein
MTQINDTARTPMSVSLVGYGFIGLGMISVISSGTSFFTVPLMKKILTDIAAGYDQPIIDYGPALDVMRHAPLMAVCSIILGAFTIYAGMQFIKLRSWARLVLEIFSWIGLVLSILIAVLFVFSYVWLGPMLVLFDDPVFARLFKTIIILCMAVAIFFIVPNFLLMVYLRSKKVRQAMQG